VRLVGYLKKKYITMHCNMNVFCVYSRHVHLFLIQSYCRRSSSKTDGCWRTVNTKVNTGEFLCLTKLLICNAKQLTQFIHGVTDY